MATETTEQMQSEKSSIDLTKCQICIKDCEDPRLLHCLHTFCAKCIQTHCGDTLPGWLVKCPVCGDDFQLESGGVEALQRNVFVAKLIKRATAAGAKMLCEGCGMKSGSKATVRCTDCGKNFCDGCSKQCRLRRKRNAGPHSVKTLNNDDDGVTVTASAVEDRDFCEHHPSFTLEKYCNECSVCFCLECEEEGKHFGHNVVSVEKAAGDFSSSLDAGVEELSSMAEELRKVKAQLEEAKSSNGAKVEHQIRQRAEDIKQLVETEMDKLIGEISEAKAPAEIEIKARVEKAYRAELAFGSFMYFAKAVKEKGTPCDVARLAADIDNRAEQLKKLEVGSGEFPMPEIKFEPTVLDDVMENIGGVRNLFGNLLISPDESRGEEMPDCQEQSAPSKPQPQEELYFSTPDDVIAIAHCDNKLYALVSRTSSVYVWAADTGDKLPEITVKCLRQPGAIATCNETNYLYIADNSMSSQCIWRVSSDGCQVQKWLPNKKSKIPIISYLLSVTSRRLLIYTNADIIFLFGPDGEKLRRIFPRTGIIYHDGIYGVAESSHDTIIISYAITCPQISEIDFDGNVLRHYSGELGLKSPHLYMSPANDGRICVADVGNCRILQLSGSLEMEKLILDLSSYFDVSQLRPLIRVVSYIAPDQQTMVAVVCLRTNNVKVYRADV